MADAKFSALTAITTPASTDEWGANQGGSSKRMTLAKAVEYFRTLISGNSGTANQNAGGETWQVLTSNASSNSTTTIATVMTTSSLPAGTYRYRYDIIVQAGLTTTSVKFSVDATGTVTRHNYSLMWPSQGVTAATGVAGISNATTGAVWAHQTSRTDNSTMGPGTDVDVANADVRMVIEGTLTTSTSGNLLLGHASEVAAASTVQAGTCLKLERLA